MKCKHLRSAEYIFGKFPLYSGIMNVYSIKQKMKMLNINIGYYYISVGKWHVRLRNERVPDMIQYHNRSMVYQIKLRIIYVKIKLNRYFMLYHNHIPLTSNRHRLVIWIFFQPQKNLNVWNTNLEWIKKTIFCMSYFLVFIHLILFNLNIFCLHYSTLWSCHANSTRFQLYLCICAFNFEMWNIDLYKALAVIFNYIPSENWMKIDVAGVGSVPRPWMVNSIFSFVHNRSQFSKRFRMVCRKKLLYTIRVGWHIASALHSFSPFFHRSFCHRYVWIMPSAFNF